VSATGTATGSASSSFSSVVPSGSASESASGGGSGTGIAGLIDGTVDVATSSREMKPEEREKIRAKRGAEVHEHVVGLDALAIVVPMEAFQMVLMSDRLHLVTHVGDWLQAVILITGITTLAGLFPAWRAARLRPVTAIQHVG
jgi:ABC-type antimicrobial peptide transport system permease subunit